MPQAHAILIPNPHAGRELGVPTEVTVSDDGTPPTTFDYDGNRYVLSVGRGAAGEWLYEHLD